MSERPKQGADPDATVMLPAGGAAAPDPDATVMIPAEAPDADATVMMPSAEPEATDSDATVMMPAAEPDADATVAIPTPGRRREAGPAPAPAVGRAAAPAELGALGGLNPLVAAANPILAVVAQIRQTLRHADPEGLRAGLREGLEGFAREAQASGAAPDAIERASFALCALIDESAACTPWGTGWARSGVLAERHGEDASGAEGFFQRLEALVSDPGPNLELLEFYYLCLALGFEGRYRGSEDGRRELTALRLRVRELLRAFRPAYDGSLSEHWRGVAAPARRPAGMLGVWAAGSGAALLLVAVYLGFSIALGTRSDPVARELAQLRIAAPAEPVSVAAPTPDISRQLAAEIGRGEVAVTDSAGQSTIVIRSDHLFASGSARIETRLEPIVLRIAEALEQVPGSVLVTGHTDDVPIRTARFPSNWELSTERAASVVKLMQGKLSTPARLRAEGLADSEPVAPNDTPANRARNRRVVIILRSAP